LLQEIWHPADGKINIYNYTHAIIKTRQSSQGGGVAIIAHRNVKAVHLKEYEVDNLEAVWADVMVGKVRTVVGSVYIPPGDIVALSKLDSVVGEIVKEHDHLVICMDANSRSTLWDDKCVGIAQSCRSLQMGAKLEEMIHRFSLQIHNSGVSTYYSGNSATTPDVTLSRGIIHYGNICWSTIDDDLNSPHLGILMNIGHKRETVRKHVIDWPNFDWSAYRVRSRVMLSELKNKWLINTSISTDVMADELSTGIQKCVNDVADTKFVTEHSKPWIDKVLSEQFKILRNQAKKCRLRKSPTNVAKYTELQQETINMVKQAEQQWWLRECEKLNSASEGEKWKIISRLTNQITTSDVQPIRKLQNGKIVYMFDDNDIRSELEDYHIHKDAQKGSLGDHRESGIRSCY